MLNQIIFNGTQHCSVPLDKIVNLPDWHLTMASHTGISHFTMNSADENLFVGSGCSLQSVTFHFTQYLHERTQLTACSSLQEANFILKLALIEIICMIRCSKHLKSLKRTLIWVHVCCSCSSDCQLWLCSGDTVSRERRRNDQWRICFCYIQFGPVESDPG